MFPAIRQALNVMGKLFMTPKLIVTLSIFILTDFACSNVDKAKTSQSFSFLDTAAYPKTNFTSVTLFSLDSSQKLKITTNSGSTMDTNALEYVSRPGFTFIDSNGLPKTKNIHAYKLDSSQIIRLENLLAQQPCGESKTMDKSCEPVFKNVYVFYDDNKKAIAQVHICFQCEMTFFKPYADYMCDFDNKVDYKSLRLFTDSLKHDN
jgi:hypothetical protein